jgi:hypothetical protein
MSFYSMIVACMAIAAVAAQEVHQPDQAHLARTGK